MYQRSKGGKTLAPMELQARIIAKGSTPRFAKMVSWKYAQMPASQVTEDLEKNHGRKTSRKLVQNLGAAVGKIALEKELAWEYELPKMEAVVTHISVGRDGTTTPVLQEGYRETMCGTIGFHNAKGERMHTIYTACAPEYGKMIFDGVMDMELARVKKQYPNVAYVGLADGAKNNWAYLESRTGVHILDFFHASEYLGEASVAMGKDDAQRHKWHEEACHTLKNKTKGANQILQELKTQSGQYRQGSVPEALSRTITYFENNLERMQYASYLKAGYPIGSGITEAACKVVVKQRLSNSGMRWTIDTVQRMLLLRGLICTSGRWQQFWDHIDKRGI